MIATDSFRTLALQVTCHAVNQARERQEARSLMQKTIDRLAQQDAASIAFIGSECCQKVVKLMFQD